MASVRIQRRWSERAACLACLLWACAAAGGAPPEPPSAAIVWWRFDPSGFASTRGGGEASARLFAGGLRAAVASGLLGDGTAAAAGQGLVGGLEMGRAPHLAAITDFRATRQADGRGMEILQLRGWAVLETADDHASFVRTLRALGVDPKNNPSSRGMQRIVRLEDGSEAALFRRADWPAWAELGWASREGRFAVGVGSGALDEWAADREATDGVPWATHRAARGSRPGEPAALFELWVDLGELRERFPIAFTAGRTPRMVTALGLENARRAMIHGWFVEPGEGGGPPAIVVTATVEDEVGAIETRQISTRARPEGALAALAAGGSYVITIEQPADELLDFGLAVYEATVEDEDLGAFREALAAYRERRADALEALGPALRPRVTLTDWPTPPAPIPGLCTIVWELSDPAGAADVEATLTRLLAPFSGRVTRREGRGGRSVWALSLDEGGVFRLPIWGVVQNGRHAALVGGWGAPVIEAAWRAWDGLEGSSEDGESGQSNR